MHDPDKHDDPDSARRYASGSRLRALRCVGLAPPPRIFSGVEKPQQMTHCLMPYEVSAHRLVGNHAVEDAPALATGADISRLTQVAQDQGDTTLAEMKSVGHVAHAQSGLTFDGEQEPPVVRQQRPFGQGKQSLRLVPLR